VSHRSCRPARRSGSPSLTLIAAASSRHGSTWREETTTCAPCSAIRSTMARPMPRGRFPDEVKERYGAVLSIALYLFCRRAYSRCGKPASEEDVQ
jgi:hypothetical protein